MTTREPAILGGKPEFNKAIPVGQLYFPPRIEYVEAMRGIFKREYYTNNGPLLIDFERRLASYLDVEEVVLVTNNTLGLIMVIEALNIKGTIMLPSLTFVASALSISRCSLKLRFCDIAPGSIFPSRSELEDAYCPNICAMLGVHLWGSCAPIAETEEWAQDRQINVFWDSAQAFGCEVDGKKVGANGEAEVFSFHATKILSTAEGGCITTNNKDLAHRLRNIRSSYGVQKKMKVNRTINARMSEMQAAVGILSLDHIEEYRYHNLTIRRAYEKLVESIPGIDLLPESGVTESNHQSVVLIIDEKKYGLSRDVVVKALNAEGVLARRYFLPSLHKLEQFTGGKSIRLPNTEYFQSNNIVMPIGARTTKECIYRICSLLKAFRLYKLT